MTNSDQPQQSDTKSVKYRHEALNYLNSVGGQFQLVKIDRIYEWIIVVALGILIVVGIFWGFFGTISTWVDGKGILLPTEQNLYTASLQEGSSKLDKYLVKVGDTVSENQLIAELSNSLLKDQITASEKYIKELEAQYTRESKQAEEETKENSKQLSDQKKNLLDSYEIIRKNLILLEENFEKIQHIKDKNVVPIQRVEQLSQYLKNDKESLNSIKSQITQKELDHQTFVDKWDFRLKDLKNKINDQKFEYEKLLKQLKASLKIVSPINGTIVSLNKSKGDPIKKGDSVAIISNNQKNVDAVMFLRPNDGKKVKVGMIALITPGTVKREEYGGIYAEITYVSSLPVTPERMNAILQNDQLSRSFKFNEEPGIEIRARLITNPNTYSGYEWSSSNGPKEEVSIGALVNSRIAVRKQTPISIVIPALNKIFGG